mgnify:CR=1 FL=1
MLTYSTAAGRNRQRECHRNDGLGRVSQPLWNCIIAESKRIPAIELAYFTGNETDFERADGSTVAADGMGWSNN